MASVVALGEIGEIGEIAESSVGARLAIPKSSTFTIPSLRTITFSGFTSRWTIPASCAAASARAASVSHRTRSSTGTLASPTYARSELPFTSSIAMYVVP